MRSGAVLLLLGFCLPQLTLAQSPAPESENANPSYFLRLERILDRQGVCVLLRGDGHYHLERHTSHKIRIFEGRLDTDDLRNIVHIVSADQLLRLDQKQIADAMIRSDADQVILAIRRPGFWQQLLFPDSASRSPYRESLDPLLQWLYGLDRRKGLELSEDAARNNCLPPSKPDFSQRTDRLTPPPDARSSASSTNAIASTPEATYVLQELDKYYGNSHERTLCLIVLTSGAYHLVLQARGIGSKKVSTAALDGTLSHAELASLREILDAPELRNEPSPTGKAGPHEVEISLAENTWIAQLSIPRDGKVQKVLVWKSVRFLGAVNARVIDEHGTKLLKPLHEWFDTHIDSRKALPTPHPANGRCDP